MVVPVCPRRGDIRCNLFPSRLFLALHDFSVGRSGVGGRRRLHCEVVRVAAEWRCGSLALSFGVTHEGEGGWGSGRGKVMEARRAVLLSQMRVSVACFSDRGSRP